MTDSPEERFQYWMILGLCGFLGSYTPTIWDTLASIGGAALIAGAATIFFGLMATDPDE